MADSRRGRGRKTPVKRFNAQRFTGQEAKDMLLPEFACIVCTRLLYVDERCWMKAGTIKKVEEGIGGDAKWPILLYKKADGTRYRDLNLNEQGSAVVCRPHSSDLISAVKRIVEYINFVNKNWCYPGDQHESLKLLHPSAEGFLSPVVVFCELTNSRNRLTRATRAGHHFISGRIGLYESRDYLGSHVGMRGLSKLNSTESSLTVQEAQRIIEAWEYLKKNHPLFQELKVSDIGGLVSTNEKLRVEEYEGNGSVNENKSKFQGYHMVPVDGGGPKSGDERYRMEDMTLGILGDDQRMVKYSNPCLLGYLFPTLYPNGRGYYSMDYAGIPKKSGVEFHEDSDDIEYIVDGGISDPRALASENFGLNEVVDEGGYVSWSDSDEESESEEPVIPSGDMAKYSHVTLKAYAKFRLLGADRRFGRNIKYILMMFDWIQKAAVFGYQLRVARGNTGGHATNVGDVLEKKQNGKGTKYRESLTVPIPSSIRTGARYKSALYLKFSALFDAYGTPQLFGTFTCDSESEGQRNLATFSGGPGSSTHDDPVLFTLHWKRKWSSFFNFVTGVWAESRVGGLRAWCWVFEMQDRGTPHTHFCLWTANSIETLIAENIVSCSSRPEKEQDRILVLKHQVHRAPCGRYCKPGGEEKCRFGFPKAVNHKKTFFDEKTGRYIMQRMEGDERIVGYNLELLKFGKVNMDLQYNVGSHAKKYMCKYISKQAGTKKATVVRETSGGESEEYVQNFHFRSVGVVEAIMDVCSWKMHGCSQMSMFLPTDLPSDRSRVLKSVKVLRDMTKERTDIWLDDKWTRYLKRPRNVEGGPDFESMTYRFFYTHFDYGKRKKSTIYIDLGNRSVHQRPSGKEALIRTKAITATKSEDAFMHLLMLHCPWRTDVDTWLETARCQSYQELALAYLGREVISRLAPGLLVVIDYGPVLSAVEAEELQEREREEFNWTKDQESVIWKVAQNIRGCRLLVTGAGGTGKSAVLEKLCRIVSTKGYAPVRLAPSGVAALNIRGETIHRWFRISKMGGSNGYPLCNSHAIREKLLDIKEEGKRPFFFIDEVSMVSGTLLTVMSRSLQEASFEDDDVLFGGYPVVMFGDYGQLSPINRRSKAIDWVWKSEAYKIFDRLDLLQGCRQRSDKGFKAMLDAVRCGELTSEACQVLVEILLGSQETGIPPNAVHLMPHKASVASLNSRRLRQLPGRLWWNMAEDDTGYLANDIRKKGIEAETGLLSKLELKIGARVMCTSNIDVRKGLVNGTLGIVEGIYGHEVVEVRADNGGLFRISQEYRSTRSDGHERRQFPLVLAWALTIHKSQSLTLDSAVVHLESSFTSGQAYVAMSRVRRREDLFIVGISVESLKNVRHAVKSRLTKERELNRTIEDDRIEQAEEEKECSEGISSLDAKDVFEGRADHASSGVYQEECREEYQEMYQEEYQQEYQDMYQEEYQEEYQEQHQEDSEGLYWQDEQLALSNDLKGWQSSSTGHEVLAKRGREYMEEYQDEEHLFHTGNEREELGEGSSSSAIFGASAKRRRVEWDENEDFLTQ